MTAGKETDIHALLVEDIPYEINVFQRIADVIVQKSIREGFALTVSEALWKALSNQADQATRAGRSSCTQANRMTREIKSNA